MPAPGRQREHAVQPGTPHTGLVLLGAEAGPPGFRSRTSISRPTDDRLLELAADEVGGEGVEQAERRAADQRAEIAAEPADREGDEAVEGQREPEREVGEGQLAGGEAGQRADARRRGRRTASATRSVGTPRARAAKASSDMARNSLPYIVRR